MNLSTHNSAVRELSASELDQVSGGGLSNTQKAVLVWTGPAGFVFMCLANGMWGHPFDW